MKFTVDKGDGDTFRVTIQLAPEWCKKHIIANEKELDDFIMSHDKPIIQILPNGKEKVISE